ncbi:hypothetical protein GCM10009543_26950 [Leifsonia naganoensis]
MSEVWNEFLEPHPFEFALDRVSPTQYIIRVDQTNPFPVELSVLFGEWLYNMRSALDYIMWAAAVHSTGQYPPPAEEALQYPIYDDEPAWKRNKWRLKNLPPHQLNMLLTMQPFNSNIDGNFLGWINRLARVDRHRRLASWTARIAEANPVFSVPSGAMPHLEWGQKTFTAGRCEVARATFPTAEAADGVEFNPRIGIDPEIAEWATSPFWSRLRFSERLHLMHVFLYAEVDLYDFDCTGNPDAASAVADTFRQDSDARRAAGLFPPIAYPSPEAFAWTQAEPGKISTRGKLQGEGFPLHGAGPAGRQRARPRSTD